MSDTNKIPLPDLSAARTFAPRVMRWGFAVVMGVFLLITALGLWRTEMDRRALDRIVAREQAAVEMLFRMQLAARARTVTLFRIVYTEDPFERDSDIQRFHAQATVFSAARRQLLQLDLDETERVLLERQNAQVAVILPLMDRVLDLLAAGQDAEARRLMVDRAVPAQNQMIDTLDAMLEYEVQAAHSRAVSTREAQFRAIVLFLVGGLIGVLLTWGILVFVTRRMGGLISNLTDTGERLRESNLDLQFQKLALDEHNIVSIADVHGNITAVNDKFCEVSQYAREELLGQNHRLLKSGAHPDAFYEDLWATISAGRVWHGEICNRCKDGTLYWVYSTILPFVGDDGLPSRYVSVRTDITRIKEAQLVLERSRDELEHLVEARTSELAEREELLRDITNAAQDAVILIDHAGLVTYWNPAAERVFGYAEAEMVGRNLHDLIVPERNIAAFREAFSRFMQSGTGPLIGTTRQVQAKRRDGVEFPAEISLSAIKLRGQWSAVGTVRDATERMQTEERLRQLATTDALTGTCNRRHFDDVLAAEIRRSMRFSSPLTLILFDIDHFKRINDTCGHQAGDRVLIQLALTVHGAIRTTDLFARWGGEEFVVLIAGYNLDVGRLLAEKLRMLLEKQNFADVGQVTCSFGVAEYAPGDDGDGLMKKADRCLYHAKASGRNRVETMATTPLPDG